METISEGRLSDVHTSCSIESWGAATRWGRRSEAFVASERSMQSVKEIISWIREWRVWRAMGLSTRQRLVAPDAGPSLTGRAILRDVTPNGVRVYSLCGCCGVPLSASATLCDVCARARRASSTPNG